MYKIYLKHHGILGQKWGKRNGPPYPLGFSDHSASERKAGWKKSLNKSNTNNKKDKSNTSEEKTKYIKIGSAFAATCLVAAGSVYLYKTGKLSKIGKKYLDNKYSGVSNNIKAVINGTVIKRCNQNNKEYDLKIINEGLSLSRETCNKLQTGGTDSLNPSESKQVLKNMLSGNLDNCVYCTNVGVLRSMGYDLQAGRSTTGHNVEEMFKYWKDVVYENMNGDKLSKGGNQNVFLGNMLFRKSDDRDRINEIQLLSNKLKNMGNGAKGDLRITGKISHSVEFRVENSKVKIFDNQLKISYNSIEEFFDKTKNYNPSTALFAGLDNCIPDLEAMLKDGLIKAR